MVVNFVHHKKLIHKKTAKFNRFELEDIPHKIKPSLEKTSG